MPIPRFDPRGGGDLPKDEDWWKQEERRADRPSAPLAPMRVPMPVGPPRPGGPPRPMQPPAQTPWAPPGQLPTRWLPEQIPWGLYQHGPEPRPAAPAGREEPALPSLPGFTPAGLGAVPEERGPQDVPAYIPTDPSSVLKDVYESPEYGNALEELYREMRQPVGPPPEGYAGGLRGLWQRWVGLGGRQVSVAEQAEALRADVEGRAPREVRPIDPQAPLAELRAGLREARELQGGDLLERMAQRHERRADAARQEGGYYLAVRHEQLAWAARGDVGRPVALGYAGTWMEQPGLIARSLMARYEAIHGDRDFAGATPDELARASALAHSAAAELDQEYAELPLSHRLVRQVGGAVEALVAPVRAEARWNPEGLPVPRSPSEVRDYMLARHGDTPEVRVAAAWAHSVAMSGAERMLAVGERVLAGEDPMAVVMGHKVNLANPTPADWQVYLDFLQAAEARGQDVDAARRYVQENGYLPGEAHGWRELAGSLWLDPTMLISYGDLAGLIGTGASMRRSVRTWTEAANAAVDVTKMDPESVRNFGRVIAAGMHEPVSAVEAMAGLAPGTVRAAEAASLATDAGRAARAAEAVEMVEIAVPAARAAEAAETAQEALPGVRAAEAAEEVAELTPAARRAARAARISEAAPEVAEVKPPSLLRKTLHELAHPMELTAEAKAMQIREPATMLATTLAPTVRTGDQAKTLVRLMAEDPSQLAVRNLLPEAIANSEAVAKVQPVFAKLAEALDDESVFSSLARPHFSVVDFVDDLAVGIRRASDELMGVTREKGPDVLFADAVRNFMGDFWMTLPPGYVVRNTGGDLATMTHDGIMVFDSWGDVISYMERVPTQTSRLMGLADAGPVSLWRGGGLTQAPYIGGTVKQMRRLITTGEIPFGQSKLAQALGLDKILEGPTILGEEVRYTRAMYAFLQKADAQWWQAQRLPQTLADVLGDAEGRRLWGVLQSTWPDEEAGLAISEFVSGRLTRFGVDAYLENPADLSPAMRAELNTSLARALRIEDAAASQARAMEIVDDLIGDVRRQADQTIATGATPPVRKVVSELFTTQDVKETTVALGGMAKAMGVADDEALRGAEAVERAIRDADQVAIDTELAALRLARENELSPEATRALVLEVRVSIEDLRMSTRATVDGLRDQAWVDYNANKSQGTAIWNGYRSDISEAWGELQEYASAAMRTMQDGVQRLAGGESVEDVLPDYGATMRSATERYTQLYEQLAEQDQALRLTEAPELTEFNKKLQLHRLAEDTAADWAWRMAVENPSIDATDILYSAERDVTELARAARARHDLARVMMETGAHTYAKFQDVVEEVWSGADGFWTQAPHRWMLAASEIADAGGLDEVLTPAAFQAVAKKAGVEIADLSAIGRDGWQSMRDGAGTLVDATQSRIMAQGNVRQAVWASQLDTVVYPVDADDVAHMMGYKPSEMSPEDWRQVARMSDQERNRWELMSSEVGRRMRVSEVSGRQAELGRGALEDVMVTAGALSRSEERKLMQGLTQRARMVEEEFVSWALRQAGYTEGDLASLNLQQQERLLLELGQGDVLRTPGGAVSRIGGVAEARRAKVIEELPRSVRDMVSENFPGTARDPLDAVVHQWDRVVKEADDWAEMLEAGVPPPTKVPERFFSPEGYPILRYGRDEIQDLVDGAAPLYQQREEYEAVRRFASERYDAWSAVDLDDAARASSTNWMAADGAEVAAADRMNARNGMATAARPADMALAAERQQVGALQGLRGRLENGGWGDALEAQATRLTEEQIQQLRDWYRTDYLPMNHARGLVTVQAARDAADFALLDYSKRRNFDTLLSQLIPYHYWYTRSARNWAIRFAARPQLARQYLTYKKWVKQTNEARGYPSRLEGMVEIPLPMLPEWTGQRTFIDPLRYAWPFQAFMNPYATEEPDDTQERGMLDGLYRAAKTLGMEPFPHLKVALILAGGLSMDPEELYNFFPQTAPLQGVTAGLRELGVQQVPPGGFFLEGWARRMLGLVEMEPAGPYRIARREMSDHLDALAAGEPASMRLALMAMELVYAIERKEIRPGEAMGLPVGDPWAAQEAGVQVSERVRLIAERGRWTEDELHSAQLMLAQATQRAALERAATSVPGYAGMPTYLYPPGEERARDLQQEARATRYSPLTGLGSRAEYQEWQREHPEALGRPLTFGLLPGEEPARTPQDALNLLDYNVQREEMDEFYGQAIDEQIQSAPEDSRSVTVLRQERAAAQADLRTRIMGDADYDEAQLWSVFGATPEERRRRRRDQALSIIGFNEPNMAAFTDPQTGEVDYDAWEKAKDDYYALGLNALLQGDPEIQQMLLEELGYVRPPPGEGVVGEPEAVGEAPEDIIGRLGDVVGTVGRSDVDAYRTRNDSPLEAAQRTWNELYSMAWEAYTKAVSEGMDKGIAYRMCIEGLPEMPASVLIPAIQKQYPDRWTEPELREALAGVRWPSGDEVHTLRKPEVEQELDRARDEFYEWTRWNVPPGIYEYDMRDAIPMLGAISDFTTREALDETGFTAEQYRETLQMIQDYVRANPSGIPPEVKRYQRPGGARVAEAVVGMEPGTLPADTEGLPDEEVAPPAGVEGAIGQEYGFARGLNRIFVRFRDAKFPGMRELLGFRQEQWGDRYLTNAERKERDAFDAAHPELGVYREWEAAYAQEHPVWAKYYKPWLLEEEEADADADGEGAGRGGWAYGGTGFSRIRDWADFAGLADQEALTALFRLWGDDASLPSGVRKRLEELHERWGWGSLDEWLDWIKQLYQDAFAGQARDVPRVQYTHWLPGMWNK